MYLVAARTFLIVGRDFFIQVVGLLKDVPQSDFAVDVLEAWKPYEGTNAFWNPLATTWKMSPVCDFNSVGVQNYTNQDMGARATANTLNLGYYDSIRKMLRLETFDRESMRSALGTRGTCSGAGCDGLLDKWQELYKLYSGGAVSTQPPVVSTGTSNVLVIDTSGSMDEALSAGESNWMRPRMRAGNCWILSALKTKRVFPPTMKWP
jgi:hypothetical protein